MAKGKLRQIQRNYIRIRRPMSIRLSLSTHSISRPLGDEMIWISSALSPCLLLPSVLFFKCHLLSKETPVRALFERPFCAVKLLWNLGRQNSFPSNQTQSHEYVIYYYKCPLPLQCPYVLSKYAILIPVLCAVYFGEHQCPRLICS